jgi:ribose 5-phosphate isomerase B|uniref:Ribose 5-phosphate isomerase B n=1 Tax=Desulfobacca acetoxidans TaxID=60893 RepID=A0A7C5ANE5_9BACT
MRVGLAADHGGFELKEQLKEEIRALGHEVVDFGAYEYNAEDDYPDFVVPLAQAVARKEVDRGIAVCGSGVGASIAANKVPGVRAALIMETYSARQGVEDDDMNIMCLGGRVMCFALAWELVQAFLKARFRGKERYQRRLEKVAKLEKMREQAG